jgi:hypothetical protein
MHAAKQRAISAARSQANAKTRPMRYRRNTTVTALSSGNRNFALASRSENMAKAAIIRRIPRI